MADFDVFTLPAHAEIVEQAVREVLSLDPELEAFTEGRIFWLPDPFAVPDAPLPFIVVTSPSWDIEHLVGSEKENDLRVAIAIAYDETRAELEPRARTVKAVQARVDIALTSRALLENTEIGVDELEDGRALVDRYEGLATVRYASQRFEEGEAFAVLELIARYRFTTDALTGQAA